MVDLDKRWVFIVTIIVIIVGTVMHFFYPWTNENKLVGYFAPVNESVWEHLKLLLFPLLAAIAIEVYLLGRKSQRIDNLWTGLVVSALVGMIFIVATFYTYTGAVTERSLSVLDIATFVAAAALASVVAHYLFKSKKVSKNTEMISIVVLIITVLAVFRFSYNPPSLPLFEEEL